MKTLSTNAALAKHVTASILGAVHEAVATQTVPSAAGSMKYSLMTNQAHVSPEEKYKLRYILPEYFQVNPPAKKVVVETEDLDDLTKTVGIPQEALA